MPPALPATGPGSDYAQLSRMVKRAGLLRRRPVYYGLKIGLNLVLLAAGWTAFAVLGHSWWQMLVAVFLAVMFTQTGFIGHDAGHRQISGSQKHGRPDRPDSWQSADWAQLRLVGLQAQPPSCLFGVYLGSSFAPNHKGMPVIGKNEKVDFLRRQVLTSRNIRGSVLTDLALGGLNYQIEHHLFPSMPRPNLRHAQAPVRAFCAQRSIPYSQTGLLASYGQVLRHLHTTGQTAGPEPAADTAAADPDAAPDPGHAGDSLPPVR